MTQPDVRRQVKSLFWQAFLLRASLALLLGLLPATDFFAPDQRDYHWVGAQLAWYWSGDLPFFELRSGEPVGYYYVVGALYWLLGQSMVWPRLLNAMIGALLVPLVFDLALRVAGDDAASLRAARYTAYFPSLILWSSLNIRDAWVILLIVVICREGVALQSRFRLGAILRLVAAVLVLTQFRGYLLYAVTLPVALSLFIQGRGNVARNAALGLLVALSVVYAERVMTTAVPDLEQLAELRRWSASEHVAGSGFARDVDLSTPGAALTFLPIGLTYFLFAPFPWAITNLRQAFTLPEVLFFYSLVPSMVRGALFLLRRHFDTALAMLLMTMVVTFAYAIGQGNVGTMYRHRAQVLPFLLIVAAVGVGRRRQRELEPGLSAL